MVKSTRSTGLVLFCLLGSILAWPGFGAAPIFTEAELEQMFDSITPEAVAIYRVSLGQQSVDQLPLETQEKITTRRAAPSELRRREFGAPIARRASGKVELRSISEGSENSVMVDTRLPPGFEVIGQLHTHPWKYEQLKNLSFSPRDIVNAYGVDGDEPYRENYPYVVLAGDEFYLLIIRDSGKARARIQDFEAQARAAGKSLNDFVYEYFYRFNRGNSIQEIHNHSVRQTVGRLSEGGMAFYRRPVGGSLELLNP